MNDAELKIGITVDSGTGAVKIRQIGKAGKDAGDDVDQGMKKGGKSLADFDAMAVTAAKGVGVVVAAIGAATAALAAMVVQSANQAREMENLSRLAGMNAQDFQAYAYATQKYGIEAEALADISKDVQDKLGDFIATGAGEFADFFENIAPKVGLTAQELAKLSGPDALIAVKKAMDDANVSAAEQVFYLESIGNDASKLIPLLAENGAELQNMAARGRELGVALSNIQQQQLLDVATATGELTTAFGATKDMVAAELAPAFTEIFSDITSLLVGSQGGVVTWSHAIGDAILTTWENIQLAFVVLVDLVMHGWIDITYSAQDAALKITSAFGLMGDNVLEVMAALLEAIAEKLGSINLTIANPFGEDWNVGFKDAAASLDNQAGKLRDASTATEDYQEAVASLYEEKQRELAIHQAVIDEMASDILQRKETVVVTDALTTSTQGASEAVQDLSTTSKNAAKQLASISDALDKMFAKEAADAIKQQEKQVASRLKLETDLLAKTKKLTLTELEYKRWALDQEVDKMRDVAGDDAQLQDMISQYRLARLDDFKTGTNDLTEYMHDRWKEAYDGIQDTLVDFVKTGELSFDSILGLFTDMLAEMLAAWLMYVGKMAVTDLFTGGDMSVGQILGLDKLTGATAGGFGGFGGNVGTAAGVAKTGYEWTTGKSLTGELGKAFSETAVGQQVNQYIAELKAGVTTFFSGTELLPAYTVAAEQFGAQVATQTAYQLALEQTAYQAAGRQFAQSIGAEIVAQEIAVPVAAEAATTEAGATAAGGAGAGTLGLGVFGAFQAAVLMLDGISKRSGVDRETLMTGENDAFLAGIADPNQDSIISTDEMFRDMQKNLVAMNEFSEAINYAGDRSSESGAEIMSQAQATELLKESVTRAGLEVDVLANVFGNNTAKMAQALDGTVGPTKLFLDGLAGYDVSMSEATRLNWLASEAAKGTTGATDQLYAALLAMTGSAESAHIATMGMISAINDLSSTPLNIDVQVNEQVVRSSSYTPSVPAPVVNVPIDTGAEHYTNRYAQGGIPPGLGISAYSNQIVNQPTLFPFAHGMGLMGEAGFEAILPLTRTASGDLGVKAETTGQGESGDPEMRQILRSIAAFTQKSAKILERFEYTGIPESKREAVA